MGDTNSCNVNQTSETKTSNNCSAHYQLATVLNAKKNALNTKLKFLIGDQRVQPPLEKCVPNGCKRRCRMGILKKTGRRIERVRPKRRVVMINEKKVNILQVTVVLKRWQNVMG